MKYLLIYLILSITFFAHAAKDSGGRVVIYLNGTW